MPAHRIPIESRFWTRVDKSGGPDACWPWLGTKGTKGYGHVWVDGRNRQVTHVALELVGRPLLPGQMACHHCDNPPCVNPSHLFAGTSADNLRDMASKGRAVSGLKLHPERAVRGERSPQAKLTEAYVREIRMWVEYGSTHLTVARMYGVSEATVAAIVKRRRWAHVL